MLPTAQDNRLFSPPILVPEDRLREFCGATLDLLQGGSANGSILAEVLPSFVSILSDSSREAGLIGDEFNGWKERSDKLIRLALLHGGDDAEALIQSLAHVRQQATRTIDALNALREFSPADRSVISRPSHEVAPLDDHGGRREPIAVERHLQDFCEAVLDLLPPRPQSGSALSQTIPSLIGMFKGCQPAVIVQLRAELQGSTAASQQLMELAAVHCDAAVGGLQQKVKLAHTHAARVINTLEALHLASYVQALNNSENEADELPSTGEGSGTDRSGPSPENRQRSRDFYQMAERCQQQQDFTTAEALYAEVLRLDQNFRLAYLHRGHIRLLRGKASKAITDLSKALRLHGQDSLAFHWRGDAFALCGRFAEALDDYDRSLELSPDSFTVRYNRAVVLRQAGNLNHAWVELKKLIRLKPNVAGLYLNRGLICLKRGKREQAIAEFQTTLTHQPNSQEAIDWLKKLGMAFDQTTAASSAKTSVSRSPKKVLKREGDVLIAAQVDEQTPQLDVAPVSIQAPKIQAPKSDDELAIGLLAEEPATTTIASDAAPPLANDLPLSITPVPTNRRLAAVSTTTASATTEIGNEVSSAETTKNTSGNIEIRCPSCDAKSFVRWTMLQPGKIMTCSRCGRNFTTESNGTLTEVVKNRKGHWKAQTEPLIDWKDYRLFASVAAVILLASVTYYAPSYFRKTVPDDAEYPKELEPRAKVFALAWLKGDYRTMRQLTDPVQSKDLFMWVMDNPAPAVKSPATLERDVNFKVVIVADDPPTTRLQVKFAGLQVANGRPISDLPLAWRQESEHWIFQPNAGSQM